MKRTAPRTAIAIAFVLVASGGLSQVTSPNECDFAFCWLTDLVEVTGHRWIPQDATEKPLEYDSDIRCIRNLKVCFWAHTVTVVGKTVAKADVWNVKRWDAGEIQAESDENITSDCERDLYILNRAERSVTLISRPGPQSNSKRCIDLFGKPKTVVYKLKVGWREDLH